MSTPNVNPLGSSKGNAAEMGQRVADTIDENRGATSSGLESAAEALHERPTSFRAATESLTRRMRRRTRSSARPITCERTMRKP